MKKLISVLLSLMLIISASAFLFSCGDEEENEGGNEKENQPCTEHVDSDENNICDNCKEILLNLPAGPVDVTVTFTVKDQDGVAVPSVTLIFTEKSDAASEPITATADASGKVTMTLKAVNYYVDCDYNVEEIGYYVLDTRSVNITESTAAMDILLTNNNPNGTLERPYPISVGDNQIELESGEANYYVVYRAVNFIANIESMGLKVTYGESEYLSDENGKIKFNLLGKDTNSVEIFKIENTTEEKLSFNVNINSAPGTLGNPYVIEELGSEITLDGISSDAIIYYTYTSTGAGSVTLTVTSENTYAAMLANSKQVSTLGEGSSSISLEVGEGDEITIDFAVTSEESTFISFILTFTPAE